MGNGYRPLGYFYSFEGGFFSAVGHIDNHANAVHLFDHLAPKSGDTTILLFITAGGQQTLIIVAELHNAHPQLLQNLHHSYIVFYRRAVLKTKDNTHLAQTLGFKDIRGLMNRHNQIGMVNKVAIPVADILQCLANIFPVGDGDMNGT